MFGIKTRTEFGYSFHTLRGDVFGGITSAVVGLPIALAFGVASGLGALAGIYGAIGVGLFTTIFGGTKGQISGPTGPMSVVVAVIFTTHADSLAHVFTIVVMAGVIQILLGALRIGRFLSFTPYSVISGFMSGIGVIIISVQILPSLGAPVSTKGLTGVISELPSAISNLNFSALVIAVVTLVVGIVWPNRLRRFTPPTLVALVVGTLLGVLWLTDTPIIGDIPAGLPLLRMPDLSPDLLLSSVEPALIIALLGAIDSLLTSLIADSMTHSRHNPNQVMFGQGVGTVFTGLIGGLPGAGSTLDSVVNIRAGGQTRVAGFLRTAVFMLVVLGIGQYLEVIPSAVLAGILIKIGWDIIDWRFIRRLHRVQREHLLVMLLTLALAIFLDMVTAVAIGLIAAGMASARQFERLELDNVVSVPILDRTFFANYHLNQDDVFSAHVGLVAFRGSFTVASAIKLVNTISVDIRDHDLVIFDFSDTVYVDDSAALVVEQLIESAVEQDTDCIVMGLEEQPAQTINALNVLDAVPREQIVETMDAARDVAWKILERRGAAITRG